MKQKNSKISIGVIGCGNWGFNHVRIFDEHVKCKLTWCCDLNTDILSKVKETHPNSKRTKNYKKVLEDKLVDALCVSSPANTHFEIAKTALENGKHVLIEKPITTNSKTAKQLVEIALKNKVVLMPGHVFMFNPAVIKMKKIIESGEIGDIYYINSVRTGFGPIRYDVNVMWDLAPHDIYTITNIIGDWPISVSANGSSFLREKIEDVVFLCMKFKNGIIANIQCSWINPTKTRLISIVGSKKMIEFDDVSNDKVKVYHKKVIKEQNVISSYENFQLLLRDGDVKIPKVSSEEPLKNEADYFLNSIFKSKMDKGLCRDGVYTISVIEAATKSIQNKSLEKKIVYPKLTI